MNFEHVAWTRRLLDRLTVGGVWRIPRSGMVIRKTGPTTVAIEVEPKTGLENSVRLHIMAAGYQIVNTVPPVHPN